MNGRRADGRPRCLDLHTSSARGRVPWPNHTDERAFADWALGQLSEWFEVDREVLGTHCGGRRLRLDAVLRPRDPSRWKDPDLAFEVEFKLPNDERRFDTGELNAWIAQAVDYTHTEWNGYGRLPVFVCQSPLEVLGTTKLEWQAEFFASHLLGKLGVGELTRVRTQGWTLLLHSHHMVWSQRRGVLEGRTWSLRLKVGSR